MFNKLIDAHNQVMEAQERFGKILEEAAWSQFEDHAGMPGVRPIAAAELARPALQAAVAEHEVTSQQAPVPEARPVPKPEPQVTLEQVRAVLATASQAGHTVRVRELIQATGAGRLSEVDPSKYAWLLAEAKGLADA